MTDLDAATVRSRCGQVWADEILPALIDYVAIPCVSAAYDPDGSGAAQLVEAVELARAWSVERPVDGLVVEVIRLPGRSPLLWIEVPPTAGVGGDTVLLYGHLDKQPAMHGWDEGLGPWNPIVRDGRLYGRGGADDGYATFASLTAIEAVQAAGGAHARCVGMFECSEESGSPDLPAYVEHLAGRIGTPTLVVCLDSSCLTYDRLWSTTSLRGNLIARLRVDVLTEGIHSGGGGGVVPSSFRVLRALLDQVEDAATGELRVPELSVEIPPGRREEIAAIAADLGPAITSSYPLVDGGQPIRNDPAAALTARTWQPSLAYTGVDGMPSGAEAGNVLRPFTSLTMSFRLPPTCGARAAAAALERTLTADPPHGATITFTVAGAEDGWDAPPTAPWLADAAEAASHAAFGTSARHAGEGGTIPFLGMLGRRFPEAQFLVTGVLGPGSNAHGPNEFLDLATGERVTVAVAHVLDAHARRTTSSP